MKWWLHQLRQNFNGNVQIDIHLAIELMLTDEPVIFGTCLMCVRVQVSAIGRFHRRNNKQVRK